MHFPCCCITQQIKKYSVYMVFFLINTFCHVTFWHTFLLYTKEKGLFRGLYRFKERTFYLSSILLKQYFIRLCIAQMLDDSVYHCAHNVQASGAAINLWYIKIVNHLLVSVCNKLNLNPAVTAVLVLNYMGI